MLDPELSKKAAKIVHTDYCLSLDVVVRSNFIKDLIRARTVGDLSPQNQDIWKLAEIEMEHICLKANQADEFRTTS